MFMPRAKDPRYLFIQKNKIAYKQIWQHWTESRPISVFLAIFLINLVACFCPAFILATLVTLFAMLLTDCSLSLVTSMSVPAL